jgi:hypothetical protein
MTDIFLSYGSEDRLKAATLAKLFSEIGWSVWWDRDLTGGQEWTPEILRRVREAKCVVVLWSRDSVGKEWVQKEAKEAENRGTIVPVLLQPSELETPTPSIQAVRLAVWKGGWTEDLRPLVEAVLKKVGHGTMPALAAMEDDKMLIRHAHEISRFEVAQIAFDYCAVSLEQEILRRSGHRFTEEEFQRKRDSYDRLRASLSPAKGTIGDEDLHELIDRFMKILVPEGS